MQNTVVIRINPNNFSKGLKYARQAHGTYNPASKTWTISVGPESLNVRNMLNLPSAYGWIIVEDNRASDQPAQPAKSRADMIVEYMRDHDGDLPEDC